MTILIPIYEMGPLQSMKELKRSVLVLEIPSIKAYIGSLHYIYIVTSLAWPDLHSYRLQISARAVDYSLGRLSSLIDNALCQ